MTLVLSFVGNGPGADIASVRRRDEEELIARSRIRALAGAGG
jgi:hypothetical protein